MTDWHLHVDDRAIPVTVRRSRRKTVALKLQPGPRLELRAPRGCPDATLRDFLDRRRAWVRRHLPDLPEPARPWQFSEGEAHSYLGRPLRLAIEQGPRRRARRIGDQLRVALPSPDRSDIVAAVVRDWYSARAQAVFAWRLNEWLQRLADWRLPEPSLRRRRMRRRWGSCTSTRVVTLNTHLVERPLGLIDFVIAHELCHLVELNHSPRFYRLMDRAMPDWRERANALDASPPGA